MNTQRIAVIVRIIGKHGYGDGNILPGGNDLIRCSRTLVDLEGRCIRITAEGCCAAGGAGVRIIPCRSG